MAESILINDANLGETAAMATEVITNRGSDYFAESGSDVLAHVLAEGINERRI